MKKLIAQRPILYMGRTYERGDTLPAHDSRMVAAWVRAKSAAWSGQENRQNTPGTEGGQEPAGDGTPAMDGQSAAEDGENGEGAGESVMLTGHLDAADLEKWKKADLEKLAADMGVDISNARNNAERAAILAAVEVQAPAENPADGGAPPTLDAGDIMQ